MFYSAPLVRTYALKTAVQITLGDCSQEVREELRYIKNRYSEHQKIAVKLKKNPTS